MLTTLKFDIRNYVDHNFDFNDDDDEELTGILHELGSTWIFGNGTGMLPNILQGICLKRSLEGRNLVFFTRSLRTFV